MPPVGHLIKRINSVSMPEEFEISEFLSFEMLSYAFWVQEALKKLLLIPKLTIFPAARTPLPSIQLTGQLKDKSKSDALHFREAFDIRPGDIRK